MSRRKTMTAEELARAALADRYRWDENTPSGRRWLERQPDGSWKTLGRLEGDIDVQETVRRYVVEHYEPSWSRTFLSYPGIRSVVAAGKRVLRASGRPECLGFPEMTMWLPTTGAPPIPPEAFLASAAEAHVADAGHAPGEHPFRMMLCPCGASRAVVCAECEATAGAVVGAGCDHLEAS